MKARTRRFEIKFNRSKNRIEKQGVRLFRAMFRSMYKDFLDEALNRPVEQWPSVAGTSAKTAQVEKVMINFYQRFAPLALMVRNNLIAQKGAEDEIWKNIYRDEMQNIVKNTAGEKITSITNTTNDKFKKIVRDVLTTGEKEGLGVEQIRRMLVKEVGENLKGNVVARARAIAQTEMISASNQAAMKAAESTGYETRKFWSTSGLENMRQSHIDAQNYSDSMEGLKDNESFPNGLLYPGDPNGSVEEVVNCRCTIMHEIV